MERKLLGEDKVFLRTASGLVKNISGIEAVLMNVVFMGFLFAFIELPFAAGLFPGAQLPISALMVIPASLAIAVMYGLFTMSMPRTGGEYVFVGRTIHPSVGFLVNFYFSAVLWSWIGSVVGWVPIYGLAPWFSALAVVAPSAQQATYWTNMAALMYDPFIGFGITFVLISIGTLVVYGGSKWVIRASYVIFAVTVVAIIAYFATILGAGHAGFVAGFNARSGTSVAAVEAAALAQVPNGFIATPIFLATFLGTLHIFLGTLGYSGNAWCAGEVKGTRTHLYAMIGAVVLFGLLVWPIYYITYLVFGFDFINASSFLATLGYPGWYEYTWAYSMPSYLIAFTTTNVWIIGLVNLAVCMVCVGSCGIVIPFLYTRNIFAWSFDRLLPSKVADLDKRGNPVWAILLMFITAQFANFLTFFTGVFAFLLYSMLGWFIGVFIVSIAAIWFPFRRKDIFDAAPPLAKKMIGPIPLISLFGILSLFVSIWVIVASLTPGAIAFFVSVEYIIGMVITLIIGPVWYFIARAYWQSKGLPIHLAHKELPPE
jgi:amino acid transporter